MTTAKVHFTKEKETMLVTLSGRAMQSQWANPILRDPWAEAAMQQIDYDMSRYYGRIFWPLVAAVIANRDITFDELTTRYLADHPEATVLHLGCGMDSRVFRVDPPAGVQWFDVDYPDVIDLRRQLFPERADYHLIGSPLDDLRWLETIPRERPALLIAEGVIPYLNEAEVKRLLNAVTRHFPSGQMIFDVFHPWVVRRMGANLGGTGASWKWGLDNPQDIRQLEPKLELIKEFKVRELAAFSRFPFWVRALCRALEVNPALRRMERIVVYRY